jgi:SET domain-containing protein
MENKIIKLGNKLPHRGVYTRLGVSRIPGVNGIGVFAIKDIPKGEAVFPGDDQEMVWVNKEDIENTETEIKALYDDFCIIKDNKFGCPKNFNVLTVGWYLNSSNDPNLEIHEDDNFYAIRDIKKGEELTSNYDSYSDEFNRLEFTS